MSLANYFTDDDEPTWTVALLLASLSDIVYEVDASTRQQRYDLLGFEQLDTIFQFLLTIGDIEASVLRSENVVVVVFRGSEDLDEPQNVIDWLSNASMSTISFCGTTKIHKGFASLATLFIPEVLARLQRLSDINEIWLTGHSLGGALAQAVGYCLHTLHPITVKRVVTFGAPRIGGALKWTAPAALSGYRVDRWVNDGDPVPRLPSIGLHNPLDPRTHLPVFWRHYGRLNYIDWSDSQVHFDDDRSLGPLIDAGGLRFSDHGIVHYKHRIFDLMPRDVKNSMIDVFTDSISIGYLLERAQYDVGETIVLSSVRDLITESGTSSVINSLRCLALRYL